MHLKNCIPFKPDPWFEDDSSFRGKLVHVLMLIDALLDSSSRPKKATLRLELVICFHCKAKTYVQTK